MAIKFELQRKILHILIGIIGILLIAYNSITLFQIFMILFLGIILSLICLKFEIPVISYFLKNFERKEDLETLPGRAVIFAVAGSLLTLKLFPREIALAAITILIFADPISHVIGKAFGRAKSPIDNKKNIEGPIAGALISSLFATFFVPFYLAFSAALVAMIFESIIIKIQDVKLDDNLIIPLAAGTVMFLITRFLI